jgi:CheY-like chemotaxis protein
MARPLLLLVDDAPDVSRVVQHLARRSGQELVCRGDVPSAWDHLHSGAPLPDLILLDMNLPGLRGLELYRRLRDEGGERARLPVALFGQWSLPDVIVEGLEAGIDFLAAKDLLSRPDCWKGRIDEILTLAAHPPTFGQASEPGAPALGRELLARLLAGLREALRPLGLEVMQAVWQRALRRVTGGSRVPDVDVWISPATLTQILSPLADARPGFAADLVLALGHQVECLLGKADSQPFRAAVAAGGSAVG